MADFSRYSATEVLKDGRTILLRAIRPDDRTAMVEGLALLGETSVYTRFHGSVREISEEDLAFYTEIDYEHHMALVAAVEDEGSERLIAGSRYIEHAGTVPRRAEVAFTVLDAFQGLGIGAHERVQRAEVALQGLGRGLSDLGDAERAQIPSVGGRQAIPDTALWRI